MAQEAGLLGNIKGILLLRTGSPHLLPEPGGFLVQIAAGLGLYGMDFCFQFSSTGQPNAAVGLFMDFEET